MKKGIGWSEIICVLSIPLIAFFSFMGGCFWEGEKPHEAEMMAVAEQEPEIKAGGIYENLPSGNMVKVLEIATSESGQRWIVVVVIKQIASLEGEIFSSVRWEYNHFCRLFGFVKEATDEQT